MLVCVSCANPLRSAQGRGLCSICGEPYDVGAGGLADTAAIAELRRLIESRIDENQAANRQLQRASRPPIWNLPLLAGHFFSWLYSHQERPEERWTEFMGWEGPLGAPLYAERAALREQRLLHALIVWSVEVSTAMCGERAVRGIGRGAVLYASLIGGFMLLLDLLSEHREFMWIYFVLAGAVVISMMGHTLRGMIAREAGGPVSDRLQREFSAVGLGFRGELRRQAMELWIQVRWASEVDREALDRREATMILQGGVDAAGQASEAMLYVQGGMACTDLVLYLPMVDVRGAIGAPAASVRAEARELIADLRRRGWLIEEMHAGIHATRLIDEAEAVTAGEWRRIAEDVRGLLGVPAGLGRLSSGSARAHLASGGVTTL